MGLVAVFAVFYVLSDFGTRSRGYKIGIHFRAASGLREAAIVYLSGVPIGAVDSISLLKDYSTEVVAAIRPGFEIPVGSRFLIQAPITGEPTILIEPPKTVDASTQTLPHEVLPIAQQPAGYDPVSFADLIEQGQGEIRRVDDLLAQLQHAEPGLLSELKDTLANADHLTTSADHSLSDVTGRVDSMAESLQTSLGAASANVVDLTGTLDSVVRRDSGQVDALLAQVSGTAKTFGETVDSLHGIVSDPRVKTNLINTTRDFALTAHTFALLTDDLRKVTNNAQTQNQLRDTIAQIDATSQKVDSLVGQLGGTSKVYGVDAGATAAPAPAALPPGQVPTSQPILPQSPQSNAGTSQAMQPAVTTVTPAPGGTAAPNGLAALRARLKRFTSDLAQLQVRASELSPERPGSANRNVSPLLTADRGPESDVNLFLLPHARSGLELGVNDIGSSGTSTANALILNRANGFTYGGGIEYSRLGVTATVGQHAFSLETRAYDLRHPTLDEYINFLLAPKLQLFGGERDISHTSRRTTFGLQFEL